MTHNDNVPQASQECPTGGDHHPDYYCPTCDRNRIAFWAGAGVIDMIVGGPNYLTNLGVTDVHISTVLERTLADFEQQTAQLPTEDLPHVIRGVISALRRQTRHLPHNQNKPETELETNVEADIPTRPNDPAHDPWAHNATSAPTQDPQSNKPIPASDHTTPETPTPTDENQLPTKPATSATTNCGHPLHHNDIHHYNEGRSYAIYILDALDAAQAQELTSAEINAHAADRVLWQHAETCDTDLRSFIAGIANANELHLQSLGTTIHF